MNDLERIQAREAYFDQYREKINDLDILLKHHERVNDEFNQIMSDLMEQRNYLKREIDAMRNIITYMLDHGCDPVEAKLTLDDDNKDEHLWKKSDYDRDMYGTLGSLSVNLMSGTIGAIGATGAVGATSSYNPMYGAVPSSAYKTTYSITPVTKNLI